MDNLKMKFKIIKIYLLVVVVSACTQVTPEDQHADPVYTFARQHVEENRRQQATQMPAWLKENREVLRDQMAVVAQKSFKETGIWFLARGAGRDKDEQETAAVWGDLLYFSDLETLPGYSKENRLAGFSNRRDCKKTSTSAPVLLPLG